LYRGSQTFCNKPLQKYTWKKIFLEAVSAQMMRYVEEHESFTKRRGFKQVWGERSQEKP